MNGYMYHFFSKLLSMCSFFKRGNDKDKEQKILNKQTTVLTSEEIINNIRTYGIL